MTDGKGIKCRAVVESDSRLKEDEKKKKDKTYCIISMALRV